VRVRSGKKKRKGGNLTVRLARHADLELGKPCQAARGPKSGPSGVVVRVRWLASRPVLGPAICFFFCC
jgi:hypothetical protein